MSMIIYRCSSCDKWSHAMKKPKHHKRLSLDPGEGDQILDEIEGYEAETGAYSPAFYIACGPFDTYEAVKVS